MIGLTWLHLRSPDVRTRRRVLAELGGRDAIREAEEIVSAVWISTLESSASENEVTLELLQRERITSAHAGRRRARAAERDQRRLTVLIRSAGVAVTAEEVVRSSRGDGPSATV